MSKSVLVFRFSKIKSVSPFLTVCPSLIKILFIFTSLGVLIFNCGLFEYIIPSLNSTESLIFKNEDEIFQAIKVYQTGEKKNVFMKDLISKMADEEIRSLANEIAQLNKEARVS